MHLKYSVVKKITPEVIVLNKRAINLHKNFDFVEAGKLQKQVYVDGKSEDALIMSVSNNKKV